MMLVLVSASYSPLNALQQRMKNSFSFLDFSLLIIIRVMRRPSLFNTLNWECANFCLTFHKPVPYST